MVLAAKAEAALHQFISNGYVKGKEGRNTIEDKCQGGS